MNDNSFYKPTDNKLGKPNATYVPDLYRQVAQEMRAEQGEELAEEAPQRNIEIQNRPMVGVMYSISAGIEGELFPVYVGRNTIGSDTTCDICLLETSVSAYHAMLLARKQFNDNGEEYVAIILSDNNSSYGTMVNNEKLTFDKVECSDGDIITIGLNYVLVLSLFNAADKLSVAQGFDRIKRETAHPVNELEPVAAVPQAPIPQAPIPQAPIPQASVPQVPQAAAPVPEGNHSTNITKDPEEDSTLSFYKPTKKKQNHYTNETIIQDI